MSTTKYERIKQSEIDELLKNATPLDDTVEAKNYKTPLDNTDTTVKNEKDTFNKNTMNETATHEEDHSSKDKEQPGLA